MYAWIGGGCFLFVWQISPLRNAAHCFGRNDKVGHKYFLTTGRTAAALGMTGGMRGCLFLHKIKHHNNLIFCILKASLSCPYKQKSIVLVSGKRVIDVRRQITYMAV